MTGRSTPEWIGATPDSAIPARVRLRIFEAHEGKCYLTGRKLMAGEYDFDHITALCNGGEHRESNIAPVYRPAHRAKTAEDVAQKSRDARKRKKHLGIHKPKSLIPGSKGSGWRRPLNGPAYRVKE